MPTGTEVWEEVASSWEQERGTIAVRAYSDAVNRALLERWLPARVGSHRSSGARVTASE